MKDLHIEVKVPEVILDMVALFERQFRLKEHESIILTLSFIKAMEVGHQTDELTIQRLKTQMHKIIEVMH